MSEYDAASPKALAAFKAANSQKCSKWATKTAGFKNEFKVPFGTRSDVDDSEFYKLKPGEEDDIEVGSMGVPEHERREMEASMGMGPYPPFPLQGHGGHHRHHSHHVRHRRSFDHFPAPPMVMMPGLPGPMPSGHHPPPPPFVLSPASPPPSAGYSHRKRSHSRPARPAPLPLQIPGMMSPGHSPHPSAGSQSHVYPHLSAVHSGGPPPLFISPPTSRVASPVQEGGHHHHHRHRHRHHSGDSSGSGSSRKHRSRSVSRPPSSAAFIYSPPGSPSPGISALAYSGGVDGGFGSRPPSVVYMPSSAKPHKHHHHRHGTVSPPYMQMQSPMRYAAVY